MRSDPQKLNGFHSKRRGAKIINQKVEQLQNEAQMLINMAKHLERLDFTLAPEIRMALSQINLLMQRAQGIAFEIAAVESNYARLFPAEYLAAISADQLIQDARSRWQQSHQAFRQSLLVQSTIVRNVELDSATLDRLIAESQAAIGSLQAQQAGNQLVALNTKQSLQLQQMMAAQYRADTLEQARSAMAEEKARVEFQRFIGDGSAYTPLD